VTRRALCASGALAGPDDGIGIVVGLIGPRGRRFVSIGHFNQGDRRAVDAGTVFEIGSVTKIFTALLLADFVRQGEVSLSDPAARYLPAETTIPERAGKKITLFDLEARGHSLRDAKYGLCGFPVHESEIGDRSLT
jgi:D-alanyl-D-alanine-carboxypeptidase/D-alanyl-D-alanine-endopeptidase